MAGPFATGDILNRVFNAALARLKGTVVVEAGETHMGEVGGDADVVDVDLVTDTSAYSANDVLSVAAAVASFARVNGGQVTLLNLLLLDDAAQSNDIDIFFLKTTGTIGTINNAISITDADAAKIIGVVKVRTGDYIDLINSKLARPEFNPMVLKVGAATTSIFVCTVLRSGTPTYAADDLHLKLGVLRG